MSEAKKEQEGPLPQGGENEAGSNACILLAKAAECYTPGEGEERGKELKHC